MKTLVLAGTITFLLFSCKNTEEVLPTSIEGTWVRLTNNDATGQVYRHELIFSADGAYEYAVQLLGNDSAVLGYVSLTTGSYEVDGNKLFRSNVSQYGLEGEHEYLDREELLLQATIEELPIIRISVNAQQDALTLDFSQGGCPAVGNCEEYQVFNKHSGN